MPLPTNRFTVNPVSPTRCDYRNGSGVITGRRPAAFALTNTIFPSNDVTIQFGPLWTKALTVEMVTAVPLKVTPTFCVPELSPTGAVRLTGFGFTTRLELLLPKVRFIGTTTLPAFVNSVAFPE